MSNKAISVASTVQIDSGGTAALVIISFPVSMCDMAEERLLVQVECDLTEAAAVKDEHSVALYRSFYRREEHISNSILKTFDH